MSQIHHISPNVLGLQKLYEIIHNDYQLALSEEAIDRIEKARNYLTNEVDGKDVPVYGVNTGFGSLCNVSIPKKDLGQLQANLVMSHACGTGDLVPEEVVKIMLFLKIQSLSYGYSGVQVATVKRLVDFYNDDVLPVIYEQGSLGASGDLAPLAHLALPIIGQGEVYYDGEIRDAAELLEELNWKPITLQSKEGLALLNGTQFMAAYGLWSVFSGYKLSYMADLIGAISLEGFDGRKEPFDPQVHQIRPHKGQMSTAKRLNEFLEGSELIEQEKLHVQDPYSFRCMPQVHGATKDTLSHVTRVILTEVNSVTDNPNVFVEEGKVVSAGNFHGQPLALVMDFLAIALAELGSISERRTYQLISGLRGLPAFLVAKPGLNSGFMIPQYTSASIVSQNKQLCTPASVDSIVSSNGQEDHVSMGANAATKLYRVVDNLQKILAIELMNASQAMEFRKPKKSSEFIESMLSTFRDEVPFVEEDRLLHYDIEAAYQFIEELELDTEIMFD
jgi:histidine ammonia-lyase